MHVYFSGIGGAGIGPLALIAHQAGFKVSGSDKQDSSYIQYLKKQGIPDIHIGQDTSQIAAVHEKTPIDWFVYSSALTKEYADHPELRFCEEHNIRTSKRDEFLSDFLQQKNLKLIAIAGTHGKTTTTAMAVWAFKQLGIPVSYSVGAKLSFGDMGEFDPASEYFVYEADEYDRNFLSFHPHIALVSGIDWDHPDIYPSREEYYAAFRQFFSQSDRIVAWQEDVSKLGFKQEPSNVTTIDAGSHSAFTLPGIVNRQDAALVATGLHLELKKPLEEITDRLNHFPGLSRRFEQIVPGLYTDYAHTPLKIAGALQLAHEKAGDNVVVVYEGLHNTRQHFIKNELKHLFDDVKKLYIVPSYLAREDPTLVQLSPADLKNLMSESAQAQTEVAELDDQLKQKIQQHIKNEDTVLCLTAGGGNSLDEWLRKKFTAK